MVSPLSSTDPVLAGGPAVARKQMSRHRGALAAGARFARFPRTSGRRWLVRLAFAAPFLAIAAWQAAGHPVDSDTPNGELLRRLGSIRWDAADVSWIHQLFPPVSTLLAAIVPGGAVGLAVVGALAAGVMLQKLLEIMVQRGYPVSTVVPLMLAIAANPLTTYLVTQNLPDLLGLLFFGMGIADVFRFVAWGHTQAGFRAGILFMFSVLTSPAAPIYVLCAALATPFLSLGRHRGRPGVRRSQVQVVIFPAVAAILTLTALAWVFTGDPLGVIGRDRFVGIGDRLENLGLIFTSPEGVFLMLTVLSAWAVGLVVRRPGTIIVSTLVFAAILFAFVVGLTPPSSAGITFVTMLMMAVSVLPVAHRGPRLVLVGLIALAQIPIAWASGLSNPVVVSWLHALGL